MAAPVWVLSVNLEAKTAAFTTGMKDAATSARSSFSSISGGAGEMGKAVEKGSFDVRHALGLVDNVMRGQHAQAMADLVREYQDSALVMTALPIAATVAGFALLGGIVFEVVQHLRAMKAEQEKVRDDMTGLGTAANDALNGLDEKLIQAGIAADNLSNNHLAALQGELALIDHQSMSELVSSFGLVQKAADTAFKDLIGHWYSWGIGSDGAKHALDQFTVKYKELVSAGKTGEAKGLLAGTLAQAKAVLQAQETIQAQSHAKVGLFGTDVDYLAQERARAVLQANGVGATKRELEAQQALVTALQTQLEITQKVQQLNGQDKSNAAGQTGEGYASRAAAARKEAVQSQLTMGTDLLTGEKATADARLTIQHASIEARLQSDLTFAQREYAMQEAANQQAIAALDKGGKDYNNQLKALQDKALEITAQHQERVAQLTAQATVAEHQRDLSNLETAIREKIGATDQGSAARLAAINAGIREEQARNLQDTQFYRSLLAERVSIAKQAAGLISHQKAEAAKEAADNDTKMGELSLAAEKQRMALEDSLRHTSAARQIAEATKLANEEYAIKQAALQKEITGLDKTDKDYTNKLKALQDKEKQLVQAHENEITAIKEKAEISRNKAITEAATRQLETINSNLVQSIMMHQTWGQTLTSIENSVVNAMLSSAIQHIEANAMTKQSDAAAAARKMFNIGLKFPFPANLIAAPTLAAAGYAEVMAFARGGIVPGVGSGDTVPAMLTPGEGIIPNGVMDGLSKMARSGGMSGGEHHHHHHDYRTFNVQALDQHGVRDVLEKHSEEFERHYRDAVRRGRF